MFEWWGNIIDSPRYEDAPVLASMAAGAVYGFVQGPTIVIQIVV